MPRHGISARTGIFVDDHRLRTLDQTDRSRHVLAIACGSVVHQRAAKVVENVIRIRAAAVEPLIHHGALLPGLRKKVPIEVRVAAGCRIRQIDIRQLAVAEFVHLAPVPFDPCKIPQCSLAFHRNHRDFPRPRAIRVGPDAKQGGFTRSFLEETIYLVGGVNFAPVYGQKIFPFHRVHTWLREWRAQLRIPILAVVDTCESITAILYFVVRAQEPHRNPPDLWNVTAKDEQVAHSQVAHHLFEQIVQLGARGETRQKDFMLPFRRRQIQTMKAGIVKEVAFEPKRFVVHLLPFDAGINANLYGSEIQSLSPARRAGRGRRRA